MAMGGRITTRAPLCVLVTTMIWLGVSTEAAKTVNVKWEVKYEFKSPDCFRKAVLTVNGMSPGPTILAQQGDTVAVEVKNGMLTENLAIHWHGIRQIGTPWADGAEGVTQCPIIPGDTFLYKFVVDRAGTYLYHAHYGIQLSSGLYGMIQVSPPDGVVEPFSYDADRSILLNDWYHKSTNDQTIGLGSIPFLWVGEPQSLLIQGRGRYNCSLVHAPDSDTGACNVTNPECAPFVLNVSPGKTYRLRIASLTSLSALSFEIEGHEMTVVEADGHYVEPFVVKNLFIYSGETYSVLLKADKQPSRNYRISTNVVARLPATPTGLGILNYSPNPPNSPETKPTTGPTWNDTALRVAQSRKIRARKGFVDPPPPKSDRLILLLNTQNKVDGHLRWSLNNISLTLPATPYLVAVKQNLTEVFDQRAPADTYDFKAYDIFGVARDVNATATASSSIYRLKFNATVDVVLQNANTLTPNNSETHPWHLHGHDFWVLGFGEGKFDPASDPKRFNLVDPVMKNTVPLHKYGWTAFRFRADNPGVWLFHCHVESHFLMGMGVVFEEGIERVGDLPTSIMGCGDSHRP